MNVAKDWDLIGRNPCDKVDPPKVSRRDIDPLEADQIKSLMTAALEHPLRAVFVLAITSPDGRHAGRSGEPFRHAGRTAAAQMSVNCQSKP